MGDRAVIIFGEPSADVLEDNRLGIYLHWHGQRTYVEGMLLAAKKLKLGSGNDDYSKARFIQMVGNAIGGTASFGVDLAKYLPKDNGDNGVYFVQDWQIVGRKYVPDWCEDKAKKGYIQDVCDQIMEANKQHFSVNA